MGFEFLLMISAAVVLKLATSVDDVIWLTKIFQGIDGWRLGIINVVYILTLSFVCILSYVLAEIGTVSFFALTGNESWFSFIASILLILFAVIFIRKEDDEQQKININTLLLLRIRDAFIISFIGSFDELTVYVVGLSTGEIDFLALLLGTVIGSIITLLVVHGVHYISGISAFFDKIPLWVIIALLGIASLIYSVWQLQS